MRCGRAILGGVLGGLAMTALMWMARTVMGMPANLELMLGTMLGLAPGLGAWLVGFGMHLMNAVIFGLIYGWLFELIGRAGWLTGAGIGLVHAIAAGFFMAMVPAMHPLIPEQMPAPGAFMANLGVMGIMAEFVLHAVYGAIVGATYGPAAPAVTVVERERSRRAA